MGLGAGDGGLDDGAFAVGGGFAGVVLFAQGQSVLALRIASAGVVGALIGSSLGKAFNGQKLLLLFALVMIVVGVLMLRGRGNPGDPGVECTIEKAPKVLGYGLVTGLFSGFFGIGGGFLIVPGLVGSTGMPIIKAIGTSLVAVAAFGVYTSAQSKPWSLPNPDSSNYRPLDQIPPELRTLHHLGAGVFAIPSETLQGKLLD